MWMGVQGWLGGFAFRKCGFRSGGEREKRRGEERRGKGVRRIFS